MRGKKKKKDKYIRDKYESAAFQNLKKKKRGRYRKVTDITIPFDFKSLQCAF